MFHHTPKPCLWKDSWDQYGKWMDSSTLGATTPILSLSNLLPFHRDWIPPQSQTILAGNHWDQVGNLTFLPSLHPFLISAEHWKSTRLTPQLFLQVPASHLHRTGARLGNKLLILSSPPPFSLQERAPATPVFSNQLTTCPVIAQEKTWVQMWWGDGMPAQNEILVFQTETKI